MIGKVIVRPLRLSANKGYDIDHLRKKLKEFKMDLIVPHRKKQKM